MHPNLKQTKNMLPNFPQSSYLPDQSPQHFPKLSWTQKKFLKEQNNSTRIEFTTKQQFYKKSSIQETLTVL